MHTIHKRGIQRILLFIILLCFFINFVSATFTIKEKDNSDVYFKISDTGNVGIGKDTTLYDLDISGSFSASDFMKISGSIISSEVYADSFRAENALELQTNLVGGYFWSISENSDNKLEFSYGSSTLDPKMTLSPEGNLWNKGTRTQSSDLRLKKDIRTIDNALDKVLSLRGVNFKFKDESHKKVYMGLVAQEVEDVLPELVGNSDNEENLKSINYQGLIPILVEARKEQRQQIIQLKEIVCRDHPEIDMCIDFINGGRK